jgi:sugar/nucleoside kinase (ribokinase family)
LSNPRTQFPADGVQRDFYLRQLRDWKASLPPEQMVPAGMTAYGQLCGWTLARAHARAGDRIALAAYLGRKDTFDQAIADFAATYADRNEKDHANLLAAIAGGRVEARTGL